MMMKSLLLLAAAMVVPNLALGQIELRLTVPEVRVRVAPPPVRVEVQPERQSSDQVWIAGHWAPRGADNVWIPGVWTTPPQEGRVWEKERWEQRNGAWFFAEGHWRWTRPSTPTEVYEPPIRREPVQVDSAPPRNLSERRSRPPFRGAIWISGYWDWDGAQHHWVSGHWSAPQRRAVWTPDRWQRARGERHGRGRGHSARWVLVPGHWNKR